MADIKNIKGIEDIEETKDIEDIEDTNNTGDILIAAGKIVYYNSSKFDSGWNKSNSLHKLRLEDADTEYSFFGNETDYRVGDYIKFEFEAKEVNGRTYYNIKNVLKYKKLSTEVIPKELDMVIDRINYKDTKPISMELAFRYGILKNYSIDEIYALYYRILKTINGENREEERKEREERDKLL